MNLSAVNLNLLVTLDALLEERSVTRAGRRLGLSQPATSAALKQLRGLFDDPLLVAGRPDMTLTARAEALRRPLKQALGQVASLFDEDEPFDASRVTAEVRICATDYVPFVMGAQLVERLAARAPGLRVRMGTARGYDVHEALAAGEFELAIGALAHAPGFRWHELFRDDGVILVRRGHPALSGARDGAIEAEDFARFPQIHLAVYRRTGSLVADANAENASPEPQFTVGSHVVAPFMLGGSDAMVVGSRRVAERLAAVLDLEMLAVPGAARSIPVIMTWHESRDALPLLRWLRAELIAIAASLDE
ncbi:MAG: LysR family transcriptional regulator [Myxococcota bacterium]